mgnify:CR=1 FL=1
MTYLGGNSIGYEAGVLKISLANSSTLTNTDKWNKPNQAVFSPHDKDARWFENKTINKSLFIKETLAHTGHPYVM